MTEVTTKRTTLSLEAFVKVVYIEHVSVPSDITDQELAELAEKRYSNADPVDYVMDLESWDRGDTHWLDTEPTEDLPTHVTVIRDASGGLVVHDMSDKPLSACQIAGIQLVQSQDEETLGRWDWYVGSDGSDTSFDTEEDAAADAVEVFFPMSDWRYEVSNADTRLGYIDWVHHRAEAFRDERSQ